MIAIGIGCRNKSEKSDLSGAVLIALREAGLDRAHVSVLATLDRREPMIRAVAADFGWVVRAFPAAELAGVSVPTTSTVVADAVGTPSVAEAAALLAAGPGSALILPKRIIGPMTVAIACQFSGVTDVTPISFHLH